MWMTSRPTLDLVERERTEEVKGGGVKGNSTCPRPTSERRESHRSVQIAIPAYGN
jgi:hypothetical protein